MIVIIAIDLVDWQVKALVSVLKRVKRAIGWSIAYIVGIPLKYAHRIHLEPDCVPSISEG